MPGKVIGTALNNGYPGTISRSGDEVSKSRPVKTGTANIYFGDPVILNTDGTIERFGATGTDAKFAGIAMRKVKSALTYVDQAAYYAALELADILQRGSVTVKVTEGTPAIGGKVYVCTVAGTTAAVGDILATATPAGVGATAVEITNVLFNSTKDTNGVAEIAILTRKNV